MTFLNRLIIGAPFGNYLRWPNTTPTLGTYTLHKRAGFLGRLWRILKTVRYYPRAQAWVNKLGLPSPGISSLRESELVEKSIISIHGFDAVEWWQLVRLAARLKPQAIEFNISCPNVVSTSIQEVVCALRYAHTYPVQIIAKLAPFRWMEMVDRLYAEGCTCFHLCNTISTPGGGMSGKPLKQYSLWAVEEVRTKYPKATIIGGGGITDTEDVRDYVQAGANHVAVASMLFNPLNWKNIKVMAECLAVH